MDYLAKLYVCIITRLQIIRVYAQSASRIHRQSDLAAMPLGDSEINDRLIKQHSLIDQMFLAHRSAILLSATFPVRYLIPQNN